MPSTTYSGIYLQFQHLGNGVGGEDQMLKVLHLYSNFKASLSYMSSYLNPSPPRKC